MILTRPLTPFPIAPMTIKILRCLAGFMLLLSMHQESSSFIRLLPSSLSRENSNVTSSKIKGNRYFSTNEKFVTNLDLKSYKPLQLIKRCFLMLFMHEHEYFRFFLQTFIFQEFHFIHEIFRLTAKEKENLRRVVGKM